LPLYLFLTVSRRIASKVALGASETRPGGSLAIVGSKRMVVYSILGKETASIKSGLTLLKSNVPPICKTFSQGTSQICQKKKQEFMGRREHLDFTNKIMRIPVNSDSSGSME